MYKLAFFDLDGTLLNSNGLIDLSSINALKRLSSNNIRLVLITGRSLKSVKKIVNKYSIYNLFSYYVCFNGALIIDNKKNKIICNYNVNSASFKDLADCANYNNINCYMVLKNNIVSKDICDLEREEAFRNEFIIRQEEFNNNLKIYKIVFNSTKEKIDLLSNIDLSKYNTIRLDDNTLEIMSFYASKVLALKRIAKEEKVYYKDIIVFGDANNDKEMLSIVGYGCAMNNASTVAKESANYVTLDNNSNGIKVAIDSILGD